MTVLLLVAIVAAFWLAIFFGFHAASGTSFLDFLRGPYEPLPEGLGTWRVIGRDESGHVLEERVLFEETDPGSFLVQRRVRESEGGPIRSVEAERRVARKRTNR